MDTHQDPQSELRSLKERFERRQVVDSIPYPSISPFQLFSRFEKEFAQGVLLKNHFGDLENVRLLEIGAGSGANVLSFLQLGLQRSNYFANELVPSLAEQLLRFLPSEQIFTGDATKLNEDKLYDVVYASTVFSSVLNRDLARAIADKMWKLTKPGGMVLWYDIRVDNPKNPDVRGIRLNKIKELFPDASDYHAQRITLAPPIGRRVGRMYNFLNFPFLRSHLLVAISK